MARCAEEGQPPIQQPPALAMKLAWPQIAATGVLSTFSDFILSFAKMVGSALNLEYKSVVVCVPPGGSISSSVRPTVMLVCKVPRRTRQLSLYVDTLL